jgi:hypothetical protein
MEVEQNIEKPRKVKRHISKGNHSGTYGILTSEEANTLPASTLIILSA